MSYYRGDYYRGDYYRGDPGLMSFLRGVGRVAGRVIGAVVPGGGVVGGAIERVSGMGGGIAKVSGKIMQIPGARAVGRVISRHPVLSAAGAAGVAGAIGGAVAGRETAPGLPGSGFHISRRTGEVVRNRHMRATNPKALRRDLRRVGGFARIAKRVLHFTSPRAARGRARFKFPRKRRA